MVGIIKGRHKNERGVQKPLIRVSTVDILGNVTISANSSSTSYFYGHTYIPFVFASILI